MNTAHLSTFLDLLLCFPIKFYNFLNLSLRLGFLYILLYYLRIMIVCFLPFKSFLFIFFPKTFDTVLSRSCHRGKLYLILHLLASIKIVSLSLVSCNLNIAWLGGLLLLFLICKKILLSVFKILGSVVWYLSVINMESARPFSVQIFLLPSLTSSDITIFSLLYLLKLSHCAWMFCSVSFCFLFVSQFEKFPLAYFPQVCCCFS